MEDTYGSNKRVSLRLSAEKSSDDKSDLSQPHFWTDKSLNFNGTFEILFRVETSEDDYEDALTLKAPVTIKIDSSYENENASLNISNLSVHSLSVEDSNVGQVDTVRLEKMVAILIRSYLPKLNDRIGHFYVTIPKCPYFDLTKDLLIINEGYLEVYFDIDPKATHFN